MSNVRLCLHKLAKNPYYIEEIRLSIYSIEELCFYLCKNPELLKEDIMDENLSTFIETELGLEELGKELRGILDKRGSLTEFVGAILKGAFYLNDREWNQIQNMLGQSPYMEYGLREKRKGDFLLESQKYTLAIEQYSSILQEAEERVDGQLYGDILHNMGVAYAQTFDFPKAEEKFRQAYEANGSLESLHHYLTVLRLISTKEEYEEFVENNGVDRETANFIGEKYGKCVEDYEKSDVKKRLGEIKEKKEKGNFTEYFGEMNELLEEWKEQYRKRKKKS